jgi:hypothetical protein
MARFKDFGSGASNGSTESEPLTFKLHDEEFTCRPEIPGKTVLNLVAKSSSEDPGETATAITGFFKTVLVAESYERFDILSEDPDRLVSMETLSNIIEWLVEQYTDRPTQRPEALPSGQ